MNARAAAFVPVLLNLALGLAFVHAGTAAWLWERVERDVPWRNGPTTGGVLVYLTIYWAAWAVLNVGARLVSPSAAWKEGETSLVPTLTAARFLVTSCVIVAVQVLMPATWFIATLAVLLVAMLVGAYLVREPLRRTLTAWAWSGAGVALATLLIHPYFVGLPLFVVRLAVVMTLWDWLGERIGVTPRLARLVPSLYAGAARARPAFKPRPNP